MWWLSQMVAERAETVATPLPTPPATPVVSPAVPPYMAPPFGPSANAQGFSTETENRVREQLMVLTEQVSPLVACQILFARYTDEQSPRPSLGLSDEMHNPCPDGHAETFDWWSPRGTSHRLCRRCGRPA